MRSYALIPLALCLLLCTTISATAQTYLYSDFAQPGDEFIYSTATNAGLNEDFNYAATGSNITWDFSALEIATQKTISYGDPEDSGYKTGFLSSCIASCLGNDEGTRPQCTAGCNTTWTTLTNLYRSGMDSLAIGTLEITDVSSLYVNDNVSGLAQNMLGFSVAIGGVPLKFLTEYSAPDIRYPFPLQLDKTASSNSHYTIDFTSLGLDIIYKSYTVRSHVVEASGTIITPYQTFTSALKLKTITQKTDTLFINGTTVPIPYPAVLTYTWFDASQGTAILEADAQQYGDATVYTDLSFLDEIRCLTPTALFAYTPLVGFLNENDSLGTSFTNLSVNADDFSWTFDDPASNENNNATDTNPTHWFTSTGTYNVALTACNNICDPLQCQTISLPVEVLDSANLTAQFSYEPSQPCAGNTVQFSNTSLNYTTSTWDFGDGSTSADDSPAHTYAAAGSYTVQLTAKDASNNSDITTLDITVGSTPMADITTTATTICPTNAVTLTTPTDATYAYLWEEVGTAETSISCTQCASPTVYPNTSTAFKLTTYSDCGVDYDTLELTVQDSTYANFTYTQDSYTITLTDASEQATSWLWNFGDTNTATEQNPTHTYATEGDYSITLEATGTCNNATAEETFSLVVTGTDEDPSFTLAIGPNPCYDRITIYGIPVTAQTVSFQLLNLQGATVLHAENLQPDDDQSLVILLTPITGSEQMLVGILKIDANQYIKKIMVTRQP